jgi:hypothetical protein
MAELLQKILRKNSTQPGHVGKNHWFIPDGTKYLFILFVVFLEYMIILISGCGRLTSKNVKNIIFASIITFLLALAPTLKGEVFSLWPTGNKGGGKNSGVEPASALSPRALFDEPVVINGEKLNLGISLVDLPLSEVFSLLKRLYPKAEYVSGPSTVLVKIKLADGWQKRLLLVYIGDRFPVIQFAMTLPPRLPSKFKWPDELPITAGGTPVRYMYFPGRSSWYGIFKISAQPAQALSEISGSLSADGWIPVSGEASNGLHGKGEMFMKKKPLSIMLFNFSQKGYGIVYTRRAR